MTVFSLKILAALTLVLGLVGRGTGSSLLAAIGTFAFPLYAFLLAEGFRHTYGGEKIRFVKKFVRLTLVMLVSEFCFDWFTFGSFMSWQGQSVMLVLWASFVALFLTEKFKDDEQMYVLVIYSVCIYVTYVMVCDFKAAGVLLPLAFYWISYVEEKKGMEKGKKVLFMVLSLLVYSLVTLFCLNGFRELSTLGLTAKENLPALLIPLLSVIPLALYNGKAGTKNRILNEAFCWFYPAALLLLGFVF